MRFPLSLTLKNDCVIFMVIRILLVDFITETFFILLRLVKNWSLNKVSRKTPILDM